MTGFVLLLSFASLITTAVRKNLELVRGEDWFDKNLDALLEDFSNLMAGVLAIISAILSIIALCIMKRKYNFEYLRTRK